MNRSLPATDQQIKLFGATYFFLFWGGVAVFLPFLTVYYVELGLSGRQIGWLAAIVPLLTLIYSPLLASFADRHRMRKRMMQTLVLGMSLVTFAFWFARSFETLLLVVILFGVFNAPAPSLADGLIARAAARRGLNFGGIRLWGSISFALIAVVCGFLWEIVGYRWMFIAGGLVFLPALWAGNQLEEPAKRPLTANLPALTVVRTVPGLIPILLTCLLTGITLGFAIIYDSILLNQTGGGSFMVGLLFGIAAMTEIPFMFNMQQMAQRLGGYSRTFMLCVVMLCIAMLGYIFAENPYVILFFGSIRGAAFALALVSSVSLIESRTPEEYTATAQSLRQAASFGLAPLIASLVGGYLFDGIGLRSVFVSGLLSAILAGLVLGWALLFGNLREDTA